MAPESESLIAFSEDFAAKWIGDRADDPDGDTGIAQACERAQDLGVAHLSAGAGAALSAIARMLDAKTVVEVGTGAGVSALWLLRGMRTDGVLTTIDVEPEHQRAAKQAFVEARIGPSRTRLINGYALEVLPRLAEDAYDMVFIDAAPLDAPRYVAEGIRLLRSGGALVLAGVFAEGQAPDPTRHDSRSVALREAAKLVTENPSLLPALLPLGSGMLCAAHR